MIIIIVEQTSNPKESNLFLNVKSEREYWMSTVVRLLFMLHAGDILQVILHFS